MKTCFLGITGIGGLVTAGMLAGSPALAQTPTKVTTFAEPTPPNGVWYKNDVRDDGTAAVVSDAVSASAASPLPPGAALLTTIFDNNSKAEVGVANSYGKASDIFPTLQLSYWFYKAANTGQNLTAAPSIKLTLNNPSCPATDDCYGALVYEPNWNAGVGPISDCSSPASIQPPLGSWQHVANINSTTGCFWWSGGFGQPNGAGGPPLHTLSEWATLFNSDPNFAGADVTLVSVGVGTYNQGQIGYFDDVEISDAYGTGFSRIYDFEPAPKFSCSGFDSPVGDNEIEVKKNRAIPFKAELFDPEGVEVTGSGVTTPPAISISFTSTDTGATPEDVTDEALPAGQSTAGNAFTFNGSQWQFNLATKNYTEAGTYTVTMVSGDQAEYVIDPTCTGTFVVQ